MGKMNFGTVKNGAIPKFFGNATAFEAGPESIPTLWSCI